MNDVIHESDIIRDDEGDEVEQEEECIYDHDHSKGECEYHN